MGYSYSASLDGNLFSGNHLNPSHHLDLETFYVLIEQQLETPILKQLAAIERKTYDNPHQMRHQLMSVLTHQDFEQYGQMICRAADLGRRRFEEKLGWLVEYQSALQQYAPLMSLVKQANIQLKHKGLRRDSHLSFRKATAQMQLSQQGQVFREEVIAYIKQQGNCMDDTQTLVASSDVLESIFGNYKFFSQRSPLKEVGRLILTIPLCTVQLTEQLVKRALESTRGIDVSDWAKRVLGQSMFAQRRAVFNLNEGDTEVA